MARLIFASPDDFKLWVDKHCFEKNYDSYLTKDNELILYPRKTSRPLTYGYIKLRSSDDLKPITDLLEARGIALYKVDRIEWDAERPLGVLS